MELLRSASLDQFRRTVGFLEEWCVHFLRRRFWVFKNMCLEGGAWRFPPQALRDTRYGAEEPGSEVQPEQRADWLGRAKRFFEDIGGGANDQPPRKLARPKSARNAYRCRWPIA